MSRIQYTRGSLVPTDIDGLVQYLIKELDSISFAISNPGSQTWQNVAASRALGTTYTNNTGQTIDVLVGVTNTVAGYRVVITVDGIVAGTGTTQFTATGGAAAYARVPQGSSYVVTGTQPGSVVYVWSELR